MRVFPPISSAQQWIWNRCRLLQCMSLFWHETDMPTALRDVRSQEQSGKHLLTVSSSQFDPTVWSGRALQEVFVDLVVSGLASMYPVSSWSCFAPDHHGYQRACVLITGQASIGPFGSPVFACAGKTDPPSLLIPLADLGWKLLIALRHRLLLISPSSFVRANGRSFVPACRRRSRRAQGRSRPAVALGF